MMAEAFVKAQVRSPNFEMRTLRLDRIIPIAASLAIWALMLTLI